MAMTGRKFQAPNSSKPRYGFNGKENDNEVKGEGNQQDYGMRIYDPRLGRFLSEDPLVRKFPMLTPYQFASNNPIWNIDIDGLEGGPANQTGLEYIVRIMDRDGIIKNDPAGTKYKYSTTESTLPHQDIFKVSGTVTTGTITMDQSGPCCPTIVRTVTYRDVSPKGSTEPRLVLWAFSEKIDGPRNLQQTNIPPAQTNSQTVPASFNTASYQSGKMIGSVAGTDPTQLDAPGQAALNTAAVGLVPTTVVGTPVAGVNAAGIPTTSVTTTTTSSIVTVNVSAGRFGGTPPPPGAAVNRLLQGRQNSIITGLEAAGIPRANIVPGTLTPNTNPAVNLNATTTTTTTTTTTAQCPNSPSSCNPPPTDINKTWQR